MKLERIMETEEFGMPRDVTVFSLTLEEGNAIKEFEDNKRRLKELGIPRSPKDYEEKWKMLQDSLTVIDPVIIPFLSGMYDNGLTCGRYGYNSNFGSGFSVFTEPVKVIETEGEFSVGPAFSFKPNLNEKLLYCWGWLDFIERDSIAEESFYILCDAFQRLYPDADGIHTPKLTTRGIPSINSVRFMPKVLGELQYIYWVLGTRHLKELKDLKEAILEERRIRKRESILNALNKEYDSIIDTLFDVSADSVRK